MNANYTEQNDVGASNRRGNTPTVTIGAQVLNDIKQYLKVINNDDLYDDCEDCRRRDCVGCWQERARELLKEVEEWKQLP